MSYYPICSVIHIICPLSGEPAESRGGRERDRGDVAAAEHADRRLLLRHGPHAAALQGVLGGRPVAGGGRQDAVSRTGLKVDAEGGQALSAVRVCNQGECYAVDQFLLPNCHQLKQQNNKSSSQPNPVHKLSKWDTLYINSHTL